MRLADATDAVGVQGGSDMFFCQAEDGIRGVAVTGVQTCALPIYADPSKIAQLDLKGKLVLVGQNPAGFKWALVKAGAIGAINAFTENPSLQDGRQWINARSEERRVGKECRSRWSPNH